MCMLIYEEAAPMCRFCFPYLRCFTGNNFLDEDKPRSMSWRVAPRLDKLSLETLPRFEGIESISNKHKKTERFQMFGKCFLFCIHLQTALLLHTATILYIQFYSIICFTPSFIIVLYIYCILYFIYITSFQVTFTFTYFIQNASQGSLLSS